MNRFLSMCLFLLILLGCAPSEVEQTAVEVTRPTQTVTVELAMPTETATPQPTFTPTPAGPTATPQPTALSIMAGKEILGETVYEIEVEPTINATMTPSAPPPTPIPDAEVPLFLAWDYRGLFGYKDIDGNWAIEPQYQHARPFSENRAVVVVDENEQGYINQFGDLIIRKPVRIPVDAFNGQDFVNGKAWIAQQYSIIDRNGTYIYNNSFLTPFVDGLAASSELVETDQGMKNLYGYKNELGEWVIPPQFEEHLPGDSKPFSEGFAVVSVFEGSYPYAWFYINTTGERLTETTFEDAHAFSQGLAGVKQNGFWGFIDTTGTWTIDAQYLRVGSFKQGLAPVQTEAGWGYINPQGDMVINPEYLSAESFRYGLALVQTKEGHYVYINPQNEVAFSATTPPEELFTFSLEELTASYEAEGVSVNGRYVEARPQWMPSDFVNISHYPYLELTFELNMAPYPFSFDWSADRDYYLNPKGHPAFEAQYPTLRIYPVSKSGDRLKKDDHTSNMRPLRLDFTSQVVSLNLDHNRSGQRYVADFEASITGAPRSPIHPNELVYRFSGTWQNYQVELYAPIITPALQTFQPENAYLGEDDYEAYIAYLADMETFINQLDDNAFTPTLTTLDALILTLAQRLP